MFDIKITTQLFILLALCGILIVCFVNFDNLHISTHSSNKESLMEVTEPFEVTSTTLSSNEQISQNITAASITNYKKKLNALFAASVMPIAVSNTQPNLS